MIRVNNIVSLFLMSICISNFSLATEIKIDNLRLEYTQTPLGLDKEQPRFSWQMISDSPGCFQKAYQIIVIDENQKKVWDTGKRVNNLSLNIKYEGDKLKPCTRYDWQLIVWDQNKKKHVSKSWFETGLMNPKQNAWNGAKWIGGGDNDLVLYSHYLSVFKINFTIQLDASSKSSKASFIFGANDERLMDRDKNELQLESYKDQSYIQVELDISPLVLNESARLNIYRRGYSKKDKIGVPIKSIAISDSLINKQNQYKKHTIFLSSVYGRSKFYINGEEDVNCVASFGLNPSDPGIKHIGYPVVGDIGFKISEGQTAYFSTIQIKNFRSPSNALYTSHVKPYKLSGEKMEILNPSKNAVPMLRTVFNTKPEITKARLYVTSRGIYDIYFNGKRVGEDYFNPGSTQYNKTLLYQTFDVTSYLSEGENGMGAILSEGWWSGGSTYFGDYWNFFGDRQSLLAKLVITYANGNADTITTDPLNWKYFNDGPTVYGSMFQGEVYDARKEKLIENWSTASYDDSKWNRAAEVPLIGNVSVEETKGNVPSVSDHSKMNLIGQFGTTVKKVKELTAISVKEIRPGVFIYDMGQNMVGVPNISLKNLVPGQKINLRFAEVIYPNFPDSKDNVGKIMLENIRTAMAKEIYIAKGGDAIITPRFTYHGFRYIEITGVKEPPPLNAVKGDVLSSIHELSSNYETSNSKVNKLWKNITWSSYGNFLSIPTDCPQRNERLGWGGDISVFSRTATHVAQLPQFFRRHMLAMRDIQREDGRFPDVAPLGTGFGETIWGSAGITVAWESYQQYNDIGLLEEHYDAMKSYIEYLIKDINPESGIFKDHERDIWKSLGDWLSLEDSRNQKLLFWEAYFIYDIEILSKMAAALNNENDAERFSKLCSERKVFFNKTYIDQETGKTAFEGKIIDTQTSYALPLAFEIIDTDSNPKVLTNFAETVTRHNKTDRGVACEPYSLLTGFIGTAWISKALSDNGYSNIAYQLLQQTSYPSWLYPVDQGATTIWERLNSYTHVNGFGGKNGMNSFNHYSFGAVGAWMYNYSLGIQRDENNPGFKHFILQPEPDPTGSMTYAKGHYNSMYGRIESSWELHGAACGYDFVVPANTSATLKLNATSINDIKSNGKQLDVMPGVKYLGKSNNKYMFEIQSGSYQIQAG